MNKIGDSLKGLLIYVSIGIIGAITTAYFIYQDRTKLWKKQAQETLGEEGAFLLS